MVEVLSVIEERKEYKDPSSFEKWIFRNGQPIRDDNSRIFVATTST